MSHCVLSNILYIKEIQISLVVQEDKFVHLFFLHYSQVKAGFGVNLIGVFVVMLAILTWGEPLFGLSEFPTWAVMRNVTGNLQLMWGRGDTEFTLKEAHKCFTSFVLSCLWSKEDHVFIRDAPGVRGKISLSL